MLWSVSRLIARRVFFRTAIVALELLSGGMYAFFSSDKDL